jgi:hypothetical protein
MAIKGYFNNLPTIEYGTKVARNLITRPKIKEFILGNPNVIYDYVIKDGERPDIIANAYYGDSNFVWLIFLANNIVDPYYDWPLTQEQFKDFIIDKYGSVETAKSTIKHYKHKTKGTLITKETYELNATMLKIVASDYQSIDVYKFEDEANEAKRSIKLIDARLATSAFAKLREAMIENV